MNNVSLLSDSRNHYKKRKHPSTPSQLIEPSKKKICYEEEPNRLNTDIKLVSLKNFVSEISCLENLGFHNRLRYLKHYMTQSKSGVYSIIVKIFGIEQLENVELNLNKPPVFIKFLMKRTKFPSLILFEGKMKEPLIEGRQYYNLIKVRELGDNLSPSHTVLKWYCSQNGTNAEVAWVCRGEQIPGNSIAKIYDIIDKMIPVKNTYLFDSSSCNNLPIRKLRILSNPIDNISSWYEDKWGFFVADIIGYKVLNKELTITADGECVEQKTEVFYNQNSFKYNKAIAFIRETTMETIVRMHKNVTLKKCIARYFPGQDSLLKEITIHDLLKEMLQAEKNPKTAKQALLDLRFFFKSVIESDVRDETKEFEKVSNALSQINSTEIFIRKNMHLTPEYFKK